MEFHEFGPWDVGLVLEFEMYTVSQAPKDKNSMPVSSLVAPWALGQNDLTALEANEPHVQVLSVSCLDFHEGLQYLQY